MRPEGAGSVWQARAISFGLLVLLVANLYAGLVLGFYGSTSQPEAWLALLVMLSATATGLVVVLARRGGICGYLALWGAVFMAGCWVLLLMPVSNSQFDLFQTGRDMARLRSF